MLGPMVDCVDDNLMGWSCVVWPCVGCVCEAVVCACGIKICEWMHRRFVGFGSYDVSAIELFVGIVLVDYMFCYNIFILCVKDCKNSCNSADCICCNDSF